MDIDYVANTILENVDREDLVLTRDEYALRIRRKDKIEPNICTSGLVANLVTLDDGRVMVNAYDHSSKSKIESVAQSQNWLYSVSERFDVLGFDTIFFYKDEKQREKFKALKNYLEYMELVLGGGGDMETLSEMQHLFQEFSDNYPQVIPLHHRMKAALEEEDYEYAVKLRDKIKEITSSPQPLDDLKPLS